MEIFPTILNLHLWSAERSAMASHLNYTYITDTSLILG